MTRPLIGRALIRLYPTGVREARGDEIVGTFLDAAGTSRRSFVANAASLARAGLSARAAEELRQPVRQIALGALGWAAVLIAMQDVVEGVGSALFWGGTVFSYGSDRNTIIDMYILPVLIMALFTTGRYRTTGVLGLLRVAMRWHQSPWMAFDEFLIVFPIQMIGFAVLLLRPKSIRPAGRFLWLIPTALWAFYWFTLLGQHSGLGRMTPVLASLVFLPLAPSLVTALGIDWLLMGLGYLAYPGGDAFPLWTVEFMACLPAVLIVAAACRRRATTR